MTQIYGESKKDSLSCFPNDFRCQKQVAEPLSALELIVYRSANSSIGWLGTNASLFFCFFSSWLRQRAPHLTVQDLIYQSNFS